MTELEKLHQAIRTLKPNVGYMMEGGIPTNETEYNQFMKWVSGKDEWDRALFYENNPHSELTWTKVKAEMDKL
tara:strand:+ start:1655 stop:1873 length:219 start_codon:yes stop_codon:yes gene_type:complete